MQEAASHDEALYGPRSRFSEGAWSLIFQDVSTEKRIKSYWAKTREWANSPTYALGREIAGRINYLIDSGDTMLVSGAANILYGGPVFGLLEMLQEEKRWAKSSTETTIYERSPETVWWFIHNLLVTTPNRTEVLQLTGRTPEYWDQRLTAVWRKDEQ